MSNPLAAISVARSTELLIDLNLEYQALVINEDKALRSPPRVDLTYQGFSIFVVARVGNAKGRL